PSLKVGGLPFAGRQLQAQDVEVVVEVAIEIEAPDLHDAQSRNSVRHLFLLSLDGIAVRVVVTMNALRAYAPVPRPSRLSPTPRPRMSRRHTAPQTPGASTAPARL